MNSAFWVFLDFNLPNATTWFYFSWLLAVALFFKFSRVLSFRNWDVVTLFLLVPGLLVIQGARTPTESHPAVQGTQLVGLHAGIALGIPQGNAFIAGGYTFNFDPGHPALTSRRWQWWGYLWLLCGSAYFLLRCLLDLILVQRPALAPNLSFGGLAWFAGALMICLTAVAFRPSEKPQNTPASLGIAAGPGPTVPAGPESAGTAQIHKQLEPWPWLQRSFAILGHLAVVIGLLVIGRWHFQDLSAGMAAATFYLMLPYTGLFFGQAHHVWPIALVVWAFAFFRLPFLTGVLLGLAAGTWYFPAAVVPAWLSFYWKRGAGRFLLAFFASVGLVIGLLLWLQDDLHGSIREAFQQNAWQAWKVPTTEGFWKGVHWSYRIPVFIAYAAFVLLTAAWPWPKNLAQVMALSAAVLIGIQFWYADQGGVYVLWYLPLLLLLVFRPNLEDRRPLPIQPETDWLSRLRAAGHGAFRRMLRLPETVRTK